ncbi:ribosomal protein S5 domain 2-type protein [Cladorrhinum sp. PSN332]|nr:ribosomal protein S5 domain 2-type protein [Cladorrhinum sp. PSN332]
MLHIMAHESITIRVPAKLNLYLEVGLLQEDGYHDMETAYQAVSLYDTLNISRHESTGAHGLTISVCGTDCERIPRNGDNIVIKAARLLFSYAGIQADGHFELTKSIPVEAGLGGGSADAAAALVGCNTLWKTGLNDQELSALAFRLGEDVPFFVKGLLAVGCRRSRFLRSLEVKDYIWTWVLGIPSKRLSTRKVYSHFDTLLKKRADWDEAAYRSRLDQYRQVAWGSTRPEDLAAMGVLVNSLENVASDLEPEVGVALEAGRRTSALATVLGGTGSSCCFLVRDETNARLLIAELQKEAVFDDLILVRGPVGGAECLDAIQGAGLFKQVEDEH